MAQSNFITTRLATQADMPTLLQMVKNHVHETFEHEGRVDSNGNFRAVYGSSVYDAIAKQQVALAFEGSTPVGFVHFGAPVDPATKLPGLSPTAGQIYSIYAAKGGDDTARRRTLLQHAVEALGADEVVINRNEVLSLPANQWVNSLAAKDLSSPAGTAAYYGTDFHRLNMAAITAAPARPGVPTATATPTAAAPR
jgi:hypothetical protein